MKATQGKANPKLLNELLRSKLGQTALQNAQIDALHRHWQLATLLEKTARLRQF
jgi:hypothetical protein